MKKIKYYSSIVKDIENVKLKDKILDIVGSASLTGILFGCPIALATLIMCAIDPSFARYTPYISLLITCIEPLIIGSFSTFKIKKRKERAGKSYDNIQELAYQLSNELTKETNSIDPEAIINAIIISNDADINALKSTKEFLEESSFASCSAFDYLKTVVEYVNFKRKIKEAKISDVYLLDNQDDIVVLEEISTTVKDGCKKEQEDYLFLLEDKEIPKPLPVDKKLKLK